MNTYSQARALAAELEQAGLQLFASRLVHDELIKLLGARV